MIFRKSLGWVIAALGVIPAVVLSHQKTYLRRSLQLDRAGEFGDRVSQIDRTDAVCISDSNGATGPTAYTAINFYYAVHSISGAEDFKLEDLEAIVYALIQTSILWCTLPDTPGIDVGGGGRKLRELLKSDQCK